MLEVHGLNLRKTNILTFVLKKSYAIFIVYILFIYLLCSVLFFLRRQTIPLKLPSVELNLRHSTIQRPKPIPLGNLIKWVSFSPYYGSNTSIILLGYHDIDTEFPRPLKSD